jgi:hypothetical protein
LAPGLWRILEERSVTDTLTLGKLLTIVQGSSTVSDTDVAHLAEQKAAKSASIEIPAFWYAVWVGVEPERAIPAVETFLASISSKADQTTFAMTFVTRLWARRSSQAVSMRQAFVTPKHLKQLYILMQTYMQESDDVVHVGGRAYSPDLRDKAQDARNALFEQLKSIPGKEAFVALAEIAKQHPVVKSRPWLTSHVRKKAEQDADLVPWSPGQVRDFHDHLDRTPTNHRELADLAVMRLRDLKDELENGDNSVATVLLRVQEESEMRNFLAHEVREKALGRYTITQEEEFADGKRPDLRFHGAGFDAPVPTELKLAERWTGPKLFERLETQLSGDYLRDRRSTRGIFALVKLAGNKRWRLPSGDQTDFDGLVFALDSHWKAIAQKHPNVEDITIIGIDLAKRFE